MTITIDLPSEVGTNIKIQATSDGVKVEDYVKTLIKEVSERRERIEKKTPNGLWLKFLHLKFKLIISLVGLGICLI